MNIDSFLEGLGESSLRLRVPAAEFGISRTPGTADALFHLPLLALAAMTIARSGPFQTAVLGRGVARLLAEHFRALRHSLHGLAGSITLRRRCAVALAFLEAADLVVVSEGPRRIVTLTQKGKRHLDRATRDTTDLGLFVRQLRISQERAKARVGNER